MLCCMLHNRHQLKFIFLDAADVPQSLDLLLMCLHANTATSQDVPEKAC